MRRTEARECQSAFSTRRTLQWASGVAGQLSSPLMVDSTAAKGSPAPSRSNATAAAFRACAESHRVSNLNKLAKSVHHTSFRWSGADEVVAEFMGIIYQIERWATRVMARIPT